MQQNRLDLLSSTRDSLLETINVPTYKFYINGKGSSWNFVNIVRDILRADPNWEEVKDPKSVDTLHYSDRDKLNPIIQNYIQADPKFVAKDYMATKLANSKHIPITLIVRNNRIMKTKHRLSTLNHNGKWFLKPTGGYGGKGINIFMGLNNYRQYIQNSTSYVLQQEVKNPILHQGYKFDIRSFVALVYLAGKYHVYLFPDGICRVSLTKYSPITTDRGADLTNCSVQEKHRQYSTEKINKLTSMFSWYNTILPKLKHVTGCCLKKMKGALKRPKGRNVIEVIALDSIIKKNKEVILLEINRNVGFGYDRKPKYITNVYKKMYRDLINFAFVPIINKQPLKKPNHWLKCSVI